MEINWLEPFLSRRGGCGRHEIVYRSLGLGWVILSLVLLISPVALILTMSIIILQASNLSLSLNDSSLVSISTMSLSSSLTGYWEG